MNCEEAVQLMPAYLLGDLEREQSQQVLLHLKDCFNCQETEKEIQFLWEGLALVPVQATNPIIRQQFTEMLDREIAQASQQNQRAEKTRPLFYFVKIAAGLMLLIAAYFLGKSSQETNSLVQENLIAPQVVLTMALIEDESASKRLQALQNVGQLPQLNEEITKALINKLNNDVQVNVRLAAAEALARFYNHKMARSALLETFKKEKDPMMQIELIQIFVALKEPAAVPIMREVLSRDSIPIYVADQLKLGLSKLL